MTMQGAYPELAKDREWAESQLKMMNLQQADRDFQIGEFYRRTGHPGSAYFYYELVRRRYPNTEYAKKAEDHMRELRGLAEREQNYSAANNKIPITQDAKIPITQDAPNAFTPGAAPSSPPREFTVPLANSMPGASSSNIPSAAPAPMAVPSTIPQPQQSPPAPRDSNQPPPPLPIGPSSTPAPRLLPPNLGPGGN